MMLRLSDVSFEREARWLLVVFVALPVLGFLLTVVIPALASWLGAR